MKLARVEAFRYRLPLVSPIQLRHSQIFERAGIILRIELDNGVCGLGDAAPLPGFSREDVLRVLEDIRLIQEHFSGQTLPDKLERLDGGFRDLLAGYAISSSARCAFESAVLHAFSRTRGTTLRGLISPTSANRIQTNALITPDELSRILEGETAILLENPIVKLKIGTSPPSDDIAIVRNLRAIAGPSLRILLDANRAWVWDEAKLFVQKTADCAVEYIEEPLREADRLAEFTRETSCSIALDETLMDKPVEFVSTVPWAKALVLKPSVLGFEHAMMLARVARTAGIRPVISAMYESGLGICTLASLAACAGAEDSYAGLDTYRRLAGDLLPERISVIRGQINLDSCDALIESLHQSLPKEVERV
jgi:O-succinylbenzoate synthase